MSVCLAYMKSQNLKKKTYFKYDIPEDNLSLQRPSFIREFAALLSTGNSSRSAGFGGGRRKKGKRKTVVSETMVKELDLTEIKQDIK